MTREQLTKQRAIQIDYCKSKIDAEDWHGVADAAMDLREIDAKLDVLATLTPAAFPSDADGLMKYLAEHTEMGARR